MDISVVIPIYNERENLRPLCADLVAALRPLQKSFELIAVDDGSTDGSAAELKQLVGEFPCLEAVLLSKNCGQSAALAAGFHCSSGQIIVTIDGDRQNDPADIPHLLDRLETGYDLVQGWRKDRRDAPLKRVLPSRLANRLIAYITGTQVHDLGFALKAMRRPVIEQLPLYGDFHRFFAVLAADRGARICEVEIRHYPRSAGISKYGLSRTPRVLLDLLAVWFLARHSAHPMRLLGSVGLVCWFVAAMAGGAACSVRALSGEAAVALAVAVSLMSACAGLNCFAIGLLSELAARILHQKTVVLPFVIRERIRQPSGGFGTSNNEPKESAYLHLYEAA